MWEEASYAQKKYCEENNIPWFAPTDLCYSCRRNIYLDAKRVDGTVSHGYTEEYAATHLITGCPHCRYSFVE